MSKAFNEGTSGYALTFGAWSTIVASRLRDIGGRFEPAQKAFFGRRAKNRDDDNCMLNQNPMAIRAYSRLRSTEYDKILPSRRGLLIFRWYRLSRRTANHFSDPEVCGLDPSDFS